MTFDAARPRYTLPFAGKDNELFGTLEVVEAIEYALQGGIIQITGRVIGMGLTDTAKLLSATLTANGAKTSSREAGQALMEMGIGSDAFALTQLHLYSFLRITLEPPEMREKKARQMGEMIGEWQGQPASRGKNTRKSV